MRKQTNRSDTNLQQRSKMLCHWCHLQQSLKQLARLNGYHYWMSLLRTTNCNATKLATKIKDAVSLPCLCGKKSDSMLFELVYRKTKISMIICQHVKLQIWHIHLCMHSLKNSFMGVLINIFTTNFDSKTLNLCRWTFSKILRI